MYGDRVGLTQTTLTVISPHVLLTPPHASNHPINKSKVSVLKANEYKANIVHMTHDQSGLAVYSETASDGEQSNKH